MRAPEFDKICAIVTTFQPSSNFIDNVERVLAQVGHVIIVDDAGTDPRELFFLDGRQNITYIRNKVNSGIARSLNIGISKAMDLGFQWMLTLDDDTMISNTYVLDLLNFYNSNVDLAPKIGVITLTRANDRNGGQKMAQAYCMKKTVITSGSLSNVDAYRAAGGFSEKYFIDLVDFEFCTKVRKKGYKIVQLSSIGMKHKVGNSVSKKFFGLSITIYHHAPFRLYYQARNSILFFRENFRFDPALSCYLLLDIIRIPLKIIYFENQKIMRLFYVYRGIRDGLKGIKGKIPSSDLSV